MGIDFGGHIFDDGRKIDVGSPEFKAALPITGEVISQVQANDDIAVVVTALTMAVMTLEVELKNLKEKVATKDNT